MTDYTSWIIFILSTYTSLPPHRPSDILFCWTCILFHSFLFTVLASTHLHINQPSEILWLIRDIVTTSNTVNNFDRFDAGNIRTLHLFPVSRQLWLLRGGIILVELHWPNSIRLPSLILSFSAPIIIALDVKWNILCLDTNPKALSPPTV